MRNSTTHLGLHELAERPADPRREDVELARRADDGEELLHDVDRQVYECKQTCYVKEDLRVKRASDDEHRKICEYMRCEGRVKIAHAEAFHARGTMKQSRISLREESRA